MRRTVRVLTVALVAVAAVLSRGADVGAQALSYARISGGGSSSAGAFVDAMRVNVHQLGLTVDYDPSGSTSGRKNFLNGSLDFAVSDLPFQGAPEDGSAPEVPASGSYAYVPLVAGGLSFTYNLTVDGHRVTALRLSGENVAKIFTRVITNWNDPALAADNPGLQLPDKAIVPVVRSDGSGTSDQLTRWMASRHAGLWDDYCIRTGRGPDCGATSFYPTVPGMVAQNGDLGVAGYLSQAFADGAIGYANYSYAIGAGLPSAKILNAAGYYTEPTPQNVAVSLLQAGIETTPGPGYLTQQLDAVYTDTDPRNYPLSSYTYLIVRTGVQGSFSIEKGRTLAAFAAYSLCQGQQQSMSLGHAPLPINLVTAGVEQIRTIPGAEVQNIDISQCANPTFSPDGRNLLTDSAPFPASCDRQGPAQCGTSTANVGQPVVLIQDIEVTRPVGALVLTQVCGSHGSLAAEGSQTGFPSGLPAEPAIDGSTVAAPTAGGTAPTTGDTPGGPADPGRAGYPYPVGADGAPVATYPTHCGIDLGDSRFVRSGAGAGQFFAADGRLNQLTLVDTRDGDLGWNVVGQVDDFRAGPRTFSGSELGWTPVVTEDTPPFVDALGAVYDQVARAGSGVAANSPVADGLAGGRLLMAADPFDPAGGTGGLGTAIADARLLLLIPVTAQSGRYTATLTLTAV